MKSETLIAHVPPRIASLVKAQAQKRQLSTSRYLGRLIEKDIEEEKDIEKEEGDEDETITYTYEDLQRIVAETKADTEAGKIKSYTDVEELIRDLHEHAGIP
ncbi:MAG: hypothetical protein LBD54_01620 [Puniceicoccales bacterium]|nr:hypothetical protein [Puniceicoccales bacterium]